MKGYTILWIRKLNIVKTSIIFQINRAFSVKTGKLILKFLWKLRGPRIGTTSLRKNRFWGQTLILRLVNTTKYWCQDTQVGQYRRVWSPEIGPHICGHLLFKRSTKAFQWRMERQSHKWGENIRKICFW